MNAVNQMIREYVIPFIVLTLLLTPFFMSLGSALDREHEFNQKIINQYRGE